MFTAAALWVSHCNEVLPPDCVVLCVVPMPLSLLLPCDSHMVQVVPAHSGANQLMGW